MRTEYHEPLIIPFSLASDTRLDWTSKAAFALISKFRKSEQGGVNAEIANILNISSRGLIRRKAKLAEYGYLKKISLDKNQVFYVPIDSEKYAIQNITSFLKNFSAYFKKLTVIQIFNFDDPVRLYNWLSLLEWQYRKKGSKMEDPFALLNSCYRKRALKLPKGFDPDWWQIELDNKAEEQKRRAEKKEQQAKEAAIRDAYHEFIHCTLPNMPRKERAGLRGRAMEALKSNGGLPEIGKETSIKTKMFDLWREERV